MKRSELNSEIPGATDFFEASMVEFGKRTFEMFAFFSTFYVIDNKAFMEQAF